MNKPPRIWIGQDDPGSAKGPLDVWITSDVLPTKNWTGRLPAAKVTDTVMWAMAKWRQEGLSEEVIDIAKAALCKSIMLGECPMLDGTYYDRGLPKGFAALGEIPPPGPDVVWPFPPPGRRNPWRK